MVKTVLWHGVGKWQVLAKEVTYVYACLLADSVILSDFN